MTKITASDMGKNSWEARKKKYGTKGAHDILKKAIKKRWQKKTK